LPSGGNPKDDGVPILSPPLLRLHHHTRHL